MSREEMIFDKEKLLEVFDETSQSGKDPVRTKRGELGPASEILSELPDQSN
jgi:NADH-quinone oxidoreductase subunit I